MASVSFTPGAVSKPLLMSIPANIGWRNAVILSRLSGLIPPLSRKGVLP